MESRQSAGSVFNPAQPGTFDGHWLAALSDETVWTPNPGPLLIVSPHPDDEVLGAGGLIRMWSERGHRVVIVSVTDGEAAYANWPNLGVVRRGELDRALVVLSSRPVAIVRLGLADGAVATSVPELLRALRRLCASRPMLIAPFEADGHPDHEAVAWACLEVARELDLPIARFLIWAWHHAQPTTLQGVRWGRFILDENTRAAKSAAINCFTSQLDPGNSREAIVPAHLLDYFKRDYEAFLI